MLFRATIEILVQADSQAEASDTIAETLRPLLRTYAPQSSVLDWQYADHGTTCADPLPTDGHEFADYASQ